MFEAGISQPGEMLALRDIIQPTIAVLTNLGAAHQENFKSMEDKCREKLVLFHDASTIVYNADDEVVNQVIAEYEYKGERLVWSMKDKKAPLFVKSIEKKIRCRPSLTSIRAMRIGIRCHSSRDDASITNSVICAIVAFTSRSVFR